MGRTKSEDAIGAKGRPFTGTEYLASLRDGREVYIYGERVEDVTTHPAFRNAARSIARLYDALHDGKTKDLLTSPTDTGSGGFTHKFFRAAHSREELIGAARCHRRLGAHVLRLDGPLARLQGLADEHARGQPPVLRKVLGQRQGLVPARAGQCPVHEPCHRQSAGRPRQGGRPGQGRVHHHPEGDRRRHLRLRRQGGGDRVGAHALQFPRPERGDGADPRYRSRGDVHRADERAGREADLPHLL